MKQEISLGLTINNYLGGVMDAFGVHEDNDIVSGF